MLVSEKKRLLSSRSRYSPTSNFLNLNFVWLSIYIKHQP